MPEGGETVGRLIVTQIGSAARRPEKQRASLIGLGLNKMHRRRELPDTPDVRGMIRAVWDLVKVEEVPAAGPGGKAS